MKFFVHLETNPVPKAVENAEAALSFAENHLQKDDEEDGSKWSVKWRRDELYPNNYCNYNFCDLVQELSSKGSVVLQVINEQDQSLLGETATIFTEAVEKKLQDEAESALTNSTEVIDRKELDLHGRSTQRRRLAARKKSKQK